MVNTNQSQQKEGEIETNKGNRAKTEDIGLLQAKVRALESRVILERQKLMPVMTNLNTAVLAIRDLNIAINEVNRSVQDLSNTINQLRGGY